MEPAQSRQAPRRLARRQRSRRHHLTGDGEAPITPVQATLLVADLTRLTATLRKTGGGETAFSASPARQPNWMTAGCTAASNPGIYSLRSNKRPRSTPG